MGANPSLFVALLSNNVKLTQVGWWLGYNDAPLWVFSLTIDHLSFISFRLCCGAVLGLFIDH